jgi:hypothetical protein
MTVQFGNEYALNKCVTWTFDIMDAHANVT